MVIDFEDIREGDRVRVTDTHGNAVEVTAHKLTGDGEAWWSVGYVHLVYKGNLDQTIELLERPGPKVERGKAYRVRYEGQEYDAMATRTRDIYKHGDDTIVLAIAGKGSLLTGEPSAFDNIEELS